MRSREESYKLIDPVTRRHLILLLYSVLESKEPNYRMMHRAGKAFQDMLEADYGYTLGYGFKDGGKSSIYDVWDDEFQEDIERYDALERLVDNSDVLLKEGLEGYYSHVLKVSSRPMGLFLLETNVRENPKRLDDIDRLVEKIRSACLDA